MSNKEKIIALTDELDAEQTVFVLNFIETYLAVERRKREDEQDRQIAAECENIYQRYKADPSSEEFVTLDELMDSLGLTEEDIRGGDPK